MYELQRLADKRVLVHTMDGRLFVGTLAGYDMTFNLVLTGTTERGFDPEGVEEMPLGLYLVRGDTVAFVGAVDDAKDGAIDWRAVTAPPLGEISVRRYQ